MTRPFTVLLCAAFIVAALIGTGNVALAAFGNQLSQCTPQFSGNGRAVAFDPATRYLYWTNNDFDTNIYVVGPTPACTTVDVLQTIPNIDFGALSWDAKRGKLWGGAYDGTGAVYLITPDFILHTATAALQFVETFPADSCYGAFASQYIDGLAYDEADPNIAADDTLWLSGDAARSIQHVSITGAPLGTSAVPSTPGGCNTGITVDGNLNLWLGMQSGPDQPTHYIVKVAKTNPSVALTSFVYSTQNPGPEDIELDLVTFPGKCALWTNQFTQAVLIAWDLGAESERCAAPPPPAKAKVTGGGQVQSGPPFATGSAIANFGFNARAAGGSADGNLEYNVKGGVTLHCHVAIITVFTPAANGGTAEFDASCTNGSTHHVKVVDSGEPGVNRSNPSQSDQFFIDGVGGPINHGNIQFHKTT